MGQVTCCYCDKAGRNDVGQGALPVASLDRSRNEMLDDDEVPDFSEKRYQNYGETSRSKEGKEVTPYSVPEISADAAKSRFNGTWAAYNSTYNTPVYHFISDNQLRWDTTTECITDLLIIDDSSCKMSHAGVDVHATLDEKATEIRWSDGDCWTRAGLDGAWKESKAAVYHHIAGLQLGTVSKNQQSIAWAPIIITDKSFSMTVGEVNFSAELDDSGQNLRWSDGDTWTRVGTSECKCLGVL